MKTTKVSIVWLFFCGFGLISSTACNGDTPATSIPTHIPPFTETLTNTPPPSPTQTPTLTVTPSFTPQPSPTTTASPTPTIVPCVWEAGGESIYYSDPERYLSPGAQSQIDPVYLSAIQEQLEIEALDMHGIAKIFNWKGSQFDKYAAGGKYVGKMSVNGLLKQKALSGCHDHGLILVSVLRAYGFPAIMVDSAGIQWAQAYNQGTQNGLSGHIFVEVYTEDKWILIDSTSGEYVEAYDPCNPVIPITKPIESLGYYAILKGLDPAGYGVNSAEALKSTMIDFAGRTSQMEIVFPPYEVKELPR